MSSVGSCWRKKLMTESNNECASPTRSTCCSRYYTTTTEECARQEYRQHYDSNDIPRRGGHHTHSIFSYMLRCVCGGDGRGRERLTRGVLGEGCWVVCRFCNAFESRRGSLTLWYRESSCFYVVQCHRKYTSEYEVTSNIHTSHKIKRGTHHNTYTKQK